MLGFLRRNCVHQTDVNSRRTLYIYRLFELSYVMVVNSGHHKQRRKTYYVLREYNDARLNLFRAGLQVNIRGTPEKTKP